MRKVFVAICLGAFSVGSFAEVKFSGDVQYRLRYDQKTIHTLVDTIKMDYSNRYAWNLKASISPNENIFIGLRLSNPTGSSSDGVEENIAMVSSGAYNLVAIPELYFKWVIKTTSLSAGIIPVEECAALNVAVYEDLRYINPTYLSWSVNMNSSQKGISADVGLLKTESIALKVGAMTSIAKNGAASTIEPIAKINHDQLRFLFTLPVAFKGTLLTVMPSMYLRTNIAQTLIGDSTSNSYAAGLDVGFQPASIFNVKLGYSLGGYSIDFKVADTTAKPIEPFGMLISAAFTVKPKYGVFQADVVYSYATEEKLSPGKVTNMVFGDLRYGMPVKKLTIQPRVRIWYSFNSVNENTEMTIRPELTLKASF